MTPLTGPRVRARHCQDWLAHVDAHEEEPWRARFREHLPPGMLEEVRDASRVGWLPLSFHVALAEATHGTFGAVRAHAFYRRAATEWLNNPLLGPVVRTVTRILDVTPAHVLRWVSRGWEVSFKDSGELFGESSEPGRGRMHYRGLPPICTASHAWLSSAQGSAYGVLDTIGFEGVVRLDLRQRGEGCMIVELEWNERRK